MALSVTARLDGQAEAVYDVLETGTINLIELDTDELHCRGGNVARGVVDACDINSGRAMDLLLQPDVRVYLQRQPTRPHDPPLAVPGAFTKEV